MKLNTYEEDSNQRAGARTARTSPIGSSSCCPSSASPRRRRTPARSTKTWPIRSAGNSAARRSRARSRPTSREAEPETAGRAGDRGRACRARAGQAAPAPAAPARLPDFRAGDSATPAAGPPSAEASAGGARRCRIRPSARHPCWRSAASGPQQAAGRRTRPPGRRRPLACQPARRSGDPARARAAVGQAGGVIPAKPLPPPRPGQILSGPRQPFPAPADRAAVAASAVRATARAAARRSVRPAPQAPRPPQQPPSARRRPRGIARTVGGPARGAARGAAAARPGGTRAARPCRARPAARPVRACPAVRRPLPIPGPADLSRTDPPGPAAHAALRPAGPASARRLESDAAGPCIRPRRFARREPPRWFRPLEQRAGPATSAGEPIANRERTRKGSSARAAAAARRSRCWPSIKRDHHRRRHHRQGTLREARHQGQPGDQEAGGEEDLRHHQPDAGREAGRGRGARFRRHHADR